MLILLIYIAICNLITNVDAHGFMSVPKAIYTDPSTKTSYIYRVDGNIIFPGLKWNDSPRVNSDLLTTKINDGSFPELKTFTDKYIMGCPINDLSKSVSVDGLTTFEWRNDEEKKGFVESHEGPCEIWIDNKKVFSDTNCAKNYISYPAVIDIDYSICSGTCQLDFYWMAMQEALWQIYKGCVTITNSQSSNTNPTSRPSTNSPTNQPTTNSPTNQPTTNSPTNQPTNQPTTNSPSPKLICIEAPSTPTSSPPTSAPTSSPPTSAPTSSPTSTPTSSPTSTPTSSPTTCKPTNHHLRQLTSVKKIRHPCN